MGCRYPACMDVEADEEVQATASMRGCRGPKPDQPVYVTVRYDRSKGGERIPITEPFDRCPRAMIPIGIWAAIQAADDLMSGILDFEPTAKLAEVMRTVRQMRQWQTKQL